MGTSGRTSIKEADLKKIKKIDMMLIKRTVPFKAMPEVLNRASSLGFKPSGFPLNTLRE